MKTHDWLVKNLPHQGKMNLLDAVVSWNADQIECVATSHRNPDNSLAECGVLGASAAIEYAAQAMAAHGRLTTPAEDAPRQGYIAAIRDVCFHAPSIDQTSKQLDIHATRLMGDEDYVIYEFSVSDQGLNLVTGRATVVLDRNSTISL